MFAELGGYGAFASQDDVPPSCYLLFSLASLRPRFRSGFCYLFSGDRLSGCCSVDVDGHDDVVAHHYLASLQAYVVCFDRRLVTDLSDLSAVLCCRLADGS